MWIPSKFEKIKLENSIYFYNIYYRDIFLVEDYYIYHSPGGGSLFIYKLDKKIQFGDKLYLINSNNMQLIIETTAEYQLKLSNNIIIYFIPLEVYTGLRWSNEYQEYPVFYEYDKFYYLKLNKNTTYYFYFKPYHGG